MPVFCQVLRANFYMFLRQDLGTLIFYASWPVAHVESLLETFRSSHGYSYVAAKAAPSSPEPHESHSSSRFVDNGLSVRELMSVLELFCSLSSNTVHWHHTLYLSTQRIYCTSDQSRWWGQNRNSYAICKEARLHLAPPSRRNNCRVKESDATFAQLLLENALICGIPLLV